MRYRWTTLCSKGGVKSKMIKLGKINYANVLPVYYHFPEESFQNKIQVISEIPAELNRKMSIGELDAGPISSFAYALHQDQYMLLPDLSVSSKGKVRSIFLFSKRPIQELSGCSIALTSSSATSVALLKVIIKEFFKVDVTYQMMEPNLKAMLEQHEAALLIGDDAIRAKWENQLPYIYDLGELWHEHTGKIMTYAVWVVQRKVAETHSDFFEELCSAFSLSKERQRQNIEPIVEKAERMYGGTPSFWREYFLGLSYDLTQEHIDGLQTFYTLAHQLGLLDDPCQVEIWQPNKTVHN